MILLSDTLYYKGNIWRLSQTTGCYNSCMMHNRTPHSKHVMHFGHAATLFSQSNPQPQFHYHKIAHSDCIGLVLLALIYNIKFWRRIDIACFQLWGTIMKDQTNMKARDLQVSTKQRGTNEQPRQRMQNNKARCWEVENTKTTSAKRFTKSTWKIHEVSRGKGPLSWNWGMPLVKSV